MTLEIYVANLSQYVSGSASSGIWQALPADPDSLEQTLNAIGVGPDQEYFIPTVESDIDGLWTVLGEHNSIGEANELAEALDNLDTYEQKTVEAIIELESPSLPELMMILETLSDYTLLPNVNTDEDLGRYFIDELQALTIPEHLVNYFDFEAYGRDVRLEGSGNFVAGGFLLTP